MYYGDSACQAITKAGTPCKNKTYFQLNGMYVCGIHGKGGVKLRKREDEKEDYVALAEQEADRNTKDGYAGYVGCGKMRMMRAVRHVRGYLTVFPNYKHGNRTDGMGLPGLSPMTLGPVVHGQKGLPPSCNLENFWQSSKKYGDETLEQFRQRQREGFLDSVPHRHNHGRKGIKPEGWMWHGELLSYIEARNYYCAFYYELATRTEDWKMLLDKVCDGFNILIVGYDAVDEDDLNGDKLRALYRDSSRPFGHELVLACMLLECYPWREGRR